MLGAPVPYADNDGVRLHYEVRGLEDAPALVMVRGLARSKSYWLDIAELFAERFHVLLLDNRGVGRSDAPRPPYTTRMLADDVAAVMDAAGFDRAHYFGVSLGGMIGQWLAIAHPHRVDRLVLGCTVARSRGSIPVDATVAFLRCANMELGEAMRVTAPYVLSEPFVQQRPEILDQWAEIARGEPSRLAGILGQGVASLLHDTRSHLGRIRAPTLVVTGDADRLIPSHNSYRLAERIPGARLRILPGAGHDFPTEQPKRTVEMVSEFVGQPAAT